MNDHEEYFDDFLVEKQRKTGRIYLWLEHVAQSRQIYKKIPLLFDGSTSWFKYEDLIDDRLDLTVLEAEKRGPALKNRLVGDAEMYKGLLDREHLKTADGVKYFRDTLRHHFIEGAQSVFLWRWIKFNRSRRGNIEMVKWVGKFSLLLKDQKGKGKEGTFRQSGL